MRIPVGTLVLVAALAALACGCGAVPRGEAGQIADPKEFKGFPLYAPGDSFEGASLELVRPRPGFVEFTYGSEAPLLVQVWPGCVRNPLLRPGVLVEGSAFERKIFVRGATAYVFEEGTRLELPLRDATVVIRASDLREAREAARSLEGVNNPLKQDERLPAAVVNPRPPFRTCRMNDPEAVRVAAALKEALAADGQPAPPIVQCGRSLAVARGDGIDDAHDCFSGAEGGEASSWCVLSRGEDLAAGTLALTCEAAVRQGAVGRPLSEAASVGWSLRARTACEPHLAHVPEVIASLDQDRLNTDFSYVWEVMGAYEAAVVADLRALPAPPAEVEEILVLYEERIAAIQAAVDQYHAGGEEEGLAALRSIELETPQLVARFETLGAPACAPPW
jgi:hypothetical protein